LSVQERPSAQNQAHRPEFLQTQTPIKEHGAIKGQGDYNIDTISNKRPCLGSEEYTPEDLLDYAPGPPETLQNAVQVF
jgi:hypothetical protein